MTLQSTSRAAVVGSGLGLLAAAVGSAVALAGGSSHSRLAAVAGWRPAERCAGGISVKDAKNDTRSWTVPAPPGQPVIPPSADLRRVELRATKAGICVRWTTAAPAPPDTTLVFIAQGPPFREPGGAQVTRGYGFQLDLRTNGAQATFGLERLGSSAPHVMRVRVGRTGSVVSAFLRKEWLRPPANMAAHWAYVYRVFSFEARVLSVPDRSGNRRVDFWPQEGGFAAYINGHLCAPNCHDPHFTPH
jgi:hypothetical protein